MDDEIVIRHVRHGELAVVAGLRWQWVVENGNTPLVAREEFVRRFVAWADDNTSSHQCLVMVRDAEVIGMAWLAVIPRVPTPRAEDRASGDVQCVYVVPEERASGLGGKLIDAIVELAHELDLERLTVHSSPRAVTAYSRHGFEVSPRLLRADLAS